MSAQVSFFEIWIFTPEPTFLCSERATDDTTQS